MQRQVFRETLWFKRGEVVEDEERVPLPIEDRYLDDGAVSGVDSFEYGLHSGETSALPVFLNKPAARASAPELGVVARELKGSRRPMIAALGASIAVAVAVFAFVF